MASVGATTTVKSVDLLPCDKTLGNKSRTVQVIVQLKKDGGNAERTAGAQKRVDVIISHALEDNSRNNGCDGNSKYSTCSLLLQIGKILGVCPPYAPSPYISSIFSKILENWCLRRDGKSNDGSRTIYQLSEIIDGDEIVLCCGDYVEDSTASLSTMEVDLLALIPSKHNIVFVSLAAAALAKEGATTEDGKRGSAENHCSVDINDDSDDDSDIENVTDLYVSEKPRASPEVIDLEDVSRDDDDDEFQSCFWDDDEYSNMRRAAHAKSSRNSKSYDDASSDDDERSDMDRNQDTESINSDSDSSSDIEDVTEIMLAKRNEQVQKMMGDAEEICDSDQDCPEDQGVVEKKRKRTGCSQSTVKPRKQSWAESPVEVLIDDKDIPTHPGTKRGQDDDGDITRSKSGDNEVEHSIKERIVKLLNTGFHGEFNEHEARIAMKSARRLCERYNLDQAVLLQEDGSLNGFPTTNDEEGSTLQGGIVTAKLRDRKKNKPLCPLPPWHDFLIQLVCTNFYVEAFTTFVRSSPRRRGGQCSVTFYGIQTNAQLAAYAFKIASERIALIAVTYEPARNSNLPMGYRRVETRAARVSYALGIVNGLKRDAKEGLQKEEERRKAKLQKAQKAAKTGEAYYEDGCSESDDHGDSCFGGVDGHDDSGKMAQDLVDHPENSHDETSSNAVEHLDKLERENTAHLALVDHRKKIAADVLKSKHVKVLSARKHKFVPLNRKATKRK